MPVLISRRPVASAFPTLLSLSKVLHIIPSLTSRPTRQHLKRGAEWSAGVSTILVDVPIEPEDPPDSPIFWWKLGLSVCLVLAGGVFAG